MALSSAQCGLLHSHTSVSCLRVMFFQIEHMLRTPRSRRIELSGVSTKAVASESCLAETYEGVSPSRVGTGKFLLEVERIGSVHAHIAFQVSELLSVLTLHSRDNFLFPLSSFAHSSQILNFLMLCTVATIWRPSSRSALLAYSKQVRNGTIWSLTKLFHATDCRFRRCTVFLLSRTVFQHGRCSPQKRVERAMGEP